MMKEGIQDLLIESGAGACYVLCIIKISEIINQRSSDVINDIERLISAGLIACETGKKNNFYVKDAGAMLTMLTGKRYAVKKENPGYIPAPGEFMIEKWALGAVNHFQMSTWRPMLNSKTVRLGKLDSYRVLYEVA